MAKKDKPAEPSNNVIDTDAVTENQNMLSTITTAHSDERDVLNQMLGQIQMGRAFAKFADVVSISKLAHIKETKMYRALAGKTGVDRDGNEITDVGTWEGFCLVIGTTRSTADEEILNFKAFGESALEDLSRIGAGIRELRQLRKLPDDEKQALIEAAKTGNKETFIELAEEIISKHAREKESLNKQVEELSADREAKDRVIADKSAKLDEVETELVKTKKRIAKIEPDQVTQELRQEAGDHVFAVEASIRGQLREALQQMQWHGDNHQTNVAPLLAGFLNQIDDAMADLRIELGIEKTADATKPEWEQT